MNIDPFIKRLAFTLVVFALVIAAWRLSHTFTRPDCVEMERIDRLRLPEQEALRDAGCDVEAVQIWLGNHGFRHVATDSSGRIFTR
ncbi:MAG: hypothetical protein ACLFTE_11415 [Salinivenus sp.]